MQNQAITGTTTETNVEELMGFLPGLIMVTPRGVESGKEGFEEWSGYDLAFDEYLTVGDAGCVVVMNETPDVQGFLSADMARLVLCAMYKQKPIVLLHPLGFSDEVDEQAARLIQDRVHKLYVHDISRIPKEDATFLLKEVNNKTIDYRLGNQEKHFIEDVVQDHLYELRAALATA